MARIELVSLSIKAGDLDAFRYISTNGIIYFSSLASDIAADPSEDAG